VSDLSKIRELLKSRIAEKEQYAVIPQKLTLNVGQEVLVKVVSIRPNPWREGKLYIVQNLDDGKIYRLPTHRVLEKELESEGVREGDIALIKLVRSYEKEVQGEEREVHVYVVAKYVPEKKEEKKDETEEQQKYIEELFKLYNGRIPVDQFKYFIETVRGWKSEDIIKKFSLRIEGNFIVK